MDTIKTLLFEVEQAVQRHYTAEVKAGKILVTERAEHEGRSIELVIINETGENIWHGDLLDSIYNVLKDTNFKYVIEDDILVIFEW